MSDALSFDARLVRLISAMAKKTSEGKLDFGPAQRALGERVGALLLKGQIGQHRFRLTHARAPASSVLDLLIHDEWVELCDDARVLEPLLRAIGLPTADDEFEELIRSIAADFQNKALTRT